MARSANTEADLLDTRNLTICASPVKACVVVKLVILSARRIGEHFGFRNTTPPLEDALSSMPGATLVMPPPLRKGTGKANGRPGSLRSRRFAPLTPCSGTRQRTTRISRSGDSPTPPCASEVWLSLDPSQLVLDRLRMLVSLQRIALCFMLYREAVQAIKHRSPELPVEWLPPGFSRAVFKDHGLSRTLTWSGSVVAMIAFTTRCCGYVTRLDTRTAIPVPAPTQPRPKSSPN